MGVRIINDGSLAAIYCSTSGTAFGPIFHGDDEGDGITPHDQAEAFLKYLPSDARTYSDKQLREEYDTFLLDKPWLLPEEEA